MLKQITALALALAFSTMFAGAQILISVEAENNHYLLYEPVTLTVTLINNSGQDLVFQDTPQQPWLTFLVHRRDNLMIQPDKEASWETLTLPPDQAKSVTVDITPLYAFREPGIYRARAVVNLSGRDFLSSPYEFSVSRGQQVWKRDRPVEGGQRTYSLHRFAPVPGKTYLYLRVEDVTDNVVYCNYRLGETVTFSPPTPAFDQQGNLHVLHSQGKGVYLYTRTGPDGKMQHQATFYTVNDSQPAITTLASGEVMVVGGRQKEADEEGGREKLSEGQALLRMAAKTKETPAVNVTTDGGGESKPPASVVEAPASTPDAAPPRQPSSSSKSR